jgi:hypothetical protein
MPKRNQTAEAGHYAYGKNYQHCPLALMSASYLLPVEYVKLYLSSHRRKKNCKASFIQMKRKQARVPDIEQTETASFTITFSKGPCFAA